MKIIFRKNFRAKRFRVTVNRDLRVTVTIPRRGSRAMAEQFVRSHSVWITSTLERFSAEADSLPPKHTAVEVKKLKLQAHKLVLSRLNHFNQTYNFKYHKISIRNQRTRWGSCSRRGNLNFNYKIALLPPELADYLIVHELCHLGELNHSSRFWELVARTIPNYLVLRRQLKTSLLL